jgi:hypothetical protein
MPSHRTVLLSGIAALACAGGAPAATALTIASSANASDGWRSIAPVGNLEGLPLANVGLAWEADHVGWNTSITFDDSDAAGWHTPFPRDLARYGSISINSIWADDPQLSGDTPAYFRKVFTLDFEPASASFGGDLGGVLTTGIDDDIQIYINGTLVYDDQDFSSGVIPFTDVTPYLHAGTNLVAAKAQDSVGVDEHFEFNLQITPIPEPSPALLIGLGLAALSRWRRRNASGSRARRPRR